MSVRDHMSQHEAAEALPLVTESAVVTEVSAMNRVRNDEVARAVEVLLENYDRADLVSWADDGGPAVDWEGIGDFLGEESPADHLTERFEKLEDRYSRPAESLMKIRFRAEEEPLDYVPGQYVTVRFHETPRPYSIANSPTEAGTELCLRRVPGGRLTSELFENLAEGDEVTIRGPNGEFVMQEPAERDMLFIATGTGVAPLKSMIDNTFETDRDVYEGNRRDVWLVLGSSWKDDLPYHEAFGEYATERENFHYVPTLSREEYLADWNGETEYVQYTFLKYLADDAVDAANLDDEMSDYFGAEPAYDIDARLDPDNLEVYACGVNAMVYPLVDVVQDAGVPETHVEAEGYG